MAILLEMISSNFVVLDVLYSDRVQFMYNNIALLPLPIVLDLIFVIQLIKVTHDYI